MQVVFQAKLALGAPLGNIAYGGKYKGTLPKIYRIVSAVAVLVYLFVMTVVMAYAIDNILYSDDFTDSVLKIMVAFFGLGTIVNAISPSKPERWWAIYTLAVLFCTVILFDIF